MDSFNFKKQVELLTNGTNTVLYDATGTPHIMVKIPKFYLDEVIPTFPHTIHPAFIVNGVEKDYIYISKYQNSSKGSLPFDTPKGGYTIAQAIDICNAKGDGWHLFTNAEWSAIALWCLKNSTLPYGNINSGSDNQATPVKGIASDVTGVVLNGTGSKKWSHNYTNNGIWDMVGQLYDYVIGARIINGEIQIIENNNASMMVSSQIFDLANYKAILEDNTLVTPGTTNTLKYHGNSGSPTDYKIYNSIANPITSYKSFNFVNCTMQDTTKNVPQLLTTLALGKGNELSLPTNHLMVLKTDGEYYMTRGMAYDGGSNSGIFSLTFNRAKDFSASAFGFRACYIEP